MKKKSTTIKNCTTLVWHKYSEEKPSPLWKRFLIYYDGYVELRLTTAGLKELGEIKDFYWAEITTPVLGAEVIGDKKDI